MATAGSPAVLRQEGWTTSRKQVPRLRRAAGLRVPPPRQRRGRRGVLPPAGPPRRRIAGRCGRGTSWRTPPCMGVRCACSRSSMSTRGSPRPAARATDRLGRRNRVGPSGHHRARRARIYPLRQRLRVYRPRSPALAGGPADQNDLHHAGESVGNRLRGKFSQSLPRRVFEPGTPVYAHRGPRRHRRLPSGLQCGATPTVPLVTNHPSASPHCS